MPEALIVVPCFDEERRIDAERFVTASRDLGLRFLMVDDGSRDGTRRVLDAMATRLPGRITVLALERNRGKAEAVRAGLLRAIAEGAQRVGYTDADTSTPLAEVARLARELDRPEVDVVLGARVALLGRAIERSFVRHVLGRAFGTVASLILALPVYDTQCGAKVLRATPALRAALAEPFLSRWAFDVELIGRLLAPRGGVAATPVEAFLEVPLERWTHVDDGRLRAGGMLRTLVDLVWIARDLRRRRLATR